MSKTFPRSGRKYDIYLAVNVALEIGRVQFAGDRRFVIREAFSKDAWEQARKTDESWTSEGTFGEADEETSLKKTDAVAPDPSLGFFYGADYV